jgi:hypothetical protein
LSFFGYEIKYDEFEWGSALRYDLRSTANRSSWRQHAATEARGLRSQSLHNMLSDERAALSLMNRFSLRHVYVWRIQRGGNRLHDPADSPSVETYPVTNGGEPPL